MGAREQRSVHNCLLKTHSDKHDMHMNGAHGVAITVIVRRDRC